LVQIICCKIIAFPYKDNLFAGLIHYNNSKRRRTDEECFPTIATKLYKKEVDELLIPKIFDPLFEHIPKIMELLLIKTPLTSYTDLLKQQSSSNKHWTSMKFDFFVRNHIKCQQILTLGYLLEKNKEAVSKTHLSSLVSTLLEALLCYEVECVQDSLSEFMQRIYEIFPAQRSSIYKLLQIMKKNISFSSDIGCYLAVYKKGFIP